MSQPSDFVYISGHGEDLRQPTDWHTVAQVNTMDLGDSYMKNNMPVDALPEKEWERHKDIPHRFDEIKEPEWVEIKEVIKTERELKEKHERSKPKPPTDSEDEVFIPAKSKGISSQNRPVHKKIGSRGNISSSSSMDSITNGMVAVGLGKVPANNIYRSKFNRKKNIKNLEINFKGKMRENEENHKSYPKEKHPKSLYIPQPDYSDEEEPQSPSQKYYYEKLLLEGIAESIPRPKLFKRQKRPIHSKYIENETFRMDEQGQNSFNDKEYGNNFAGNFEYHGSEYIQDYEYNENEEYLDHNAEYGGKGNYYTPEHHPYNETEY